MTQEVAADRHSGTSRRGLLHVLNGDHTRLKLERSGVPGAIAVWADVLHDGPAVPAAPDEWRRIRARHLASQGVMPEESILEQLRRWDAQLESFSEHGEVVFWFEHDLFDQLLLVRHLHWVADVQRRADTRFSLICIGSFPGVPDFAGLGQLAADQLASLLETRQRITEAQIELGVETWNRFCAPDPLPLAALLAEDTSALPFLDGALRRFLEDYPAVDTGLARSERQILEAIAAGTVSPGAVFRATQKMEERIFMGDWTYWAIVRRLASGRAPLLGMNAPMTGPELPDGALHLTDDGRRVLDDAADYVALNGIDRWMGGVHLKDGRYRWYGERGLVVKS
jgi:hypothetical protein